MKSRAQDLSFTKRVTALLDSLNIDSKYETTLLDNLESSYKSDIDSIVTLKTTEQHLTKTLAQKNRNTINSKEEDNPISDQLDLLKHELSLYRETIKNINLEIDEITEVLSTANVQDKEKILILKKTLAALRENFKTEQKNLKLKQKELENLKQKKETLENLKILQKKQKKQLESAKNNLDIGPFSKFLLPGKWLDNYKENLINKVGKLQEKIKTTEQTIDSLKAPPSKTAAKTVVVPNIALPTSSQSISTATSIVTKPQPVLKSTQVGQAPKLKKLQSAQQQKPQSLPVPNILFKQNVILTSSSKSKLAPSATPTNNSTAQQIQKEKNAQFIRKRS